MAPVLNQLVTPDEDIRSHSIRFHTDGEIGKLTFRNGKLDFEGEATESACLFLACIGAPLRQEHNELMSKIRVQGVRIRHLQDTETKYRELCNSVKTLLRVIRYTEMDADLSVAASSFATTHPDLNVD